MLMVFLFNASVGLCMRSLTQRLDLLAFGQIVKSILLYALNSVKFWLMFLVIMHYAVLFGSVVIAGVSISGFDLLWKN